MLSDPKFPETLTEPSIKSDTKAMSPDHFDRIESLRTALIMQACTDDVRGAFGELIDAMQAIVGQRSSKQQREDDGFLNSTLKLIENLLDASNDVAQAGHSWVEDYVGTGR